MNTANQHRLTSLWVVGFVSVVAITSSHQSALAQSDASCPVVKAISIGDPAALTGIAATINEHGSLDLTLQGVRGILTDAAECDLYSPQDGWDIGCSWRYSQDEAQQADAQLERLRQQLDQCWPEPLKEQEPRQYIPELENLRDYRSVIEIDAESQVFARLKMHRYVQGGRLVVRVSFSQD